MIYNETERDILIVSQWNDVRPSHKADTQMAAHNGCLRLASLGLLERTGDGRYTITATGRVEAAKIMEDAKPT